MYVRAIFNLEMWETEKENLDNLKLCAFSSFFDVFHDELSIFKLCKDESDSEVCPIALRLFLSNPKKYNSFYLFKLDDIILSQMPAVQDDEEIAKTIHANIPGINYKHFKTIVEHTFKYYKTNLIDCSMERLQKLFKNIGADFLNKMIRDLYSDKKSREDHYKKFQETFFKFNKQDCPVCNF